MKLAKKYPLLTLLILGLLLRLSLLFIDYSWDINNHIAWAKDLHSRGFQGFYETPSSEVYATVYPNYPPLSLFIFYLVYPIQSIIYLVAWWLNLTIPLFPSKLIFFLKDRVFLAAMFKLPAIIADLGIAWLSFLFAKKIIPKNSKVQNLASIFVLFNPVFFYNSSLWGQIDSLPIFLVLLSCYLLLFTKRFILSGILFVSALLVKPTAFVYLLLYAVFFIRKYSLLNFLKTVLLSLLLFYFSFIPFLDNLSNPPLPFTIFSQKILAAQSLPFVTNGAFNFWVLITGFEGIRDTTPFIFGMSYRLWGYLITVFFALFILIRLSHSGGRQRIQNRFWTSYNPENSKNQNDIFYSTFLTAFASFLFLTKMHERYSILPLPFLLLAGLKNQKLLKWFVLLSLLSFLNLYHSWPVPKINLIFAVISNPQVVLVLSLLNVLIFLYLLTFYLTSFWQARNERDVKRPSHVRRWRVQNRFWSPPPKAGSPE